jgi:hypothetical protein
MESGELDDLHGLKALLFRSTEGKRALSDNSTRLKATLIIDEALDLYKSRL